MTFLPFHLCYFCLPILPQSATTFQRKKSLYWILRDIGLRKYRPNQAKFAQLIQNEVFLRNSMCLFCLPMLVHDEAN